MKAGDRRGAVLGWVIILFMMVALMTGVTLSASFGYYNHVLAGSRKQQAAFTARSVAEVIAGSLSREPGSDNLTAVLLQEQSGSVIRVDGLDAAMGSCSVVSGYDEAGNLLVTVTVETGEITKSVTAGFRPAGTEAPELEGEGPVKWELAELRAGENYERME